MKKYAYSWMKNVIFAAIVAIAARARAADTLAPFVCAVYFMARETKGNPMTLLGGCASGCIFAAGGIAGWQPLFGCALVELLCLVPWKERFGAPAWSGICAFAGTLIPGILFSSGIAYNLLSSVLCAIVAMATAPVLLPFGGDWIKRGTCTGEEQLALAGMAIVAAIGLDGLAQGIFVAAAVVAASSGGAGMGALTGVMMGAAVVFSGGQNVSAAVLGMAGALCGMLSGISVWLRVPVFVAVCQMTYLGPFGYSLPAVPMMESVIGALAATVIPEDRIKGFFLAEKDARTEYAYARVMAKKMQIAEVMLGDMASCAQEKGMRQMLLHLKSALTDSEKCESAAPLRLRAIAGASARARGRVNGDSYAVQKLPDGRIFAIICDGMGTGEEAQRQSARTVRLIRSLLNAGMSAEAALEMANILLMGQGETFSTLDLAVINLRNATAQIYKMAAPPSIYLHGGRAVQIAGSRLPIGIVEENHPSSARIALKKGDVLFLGSDGVTDAYAPGEIASRLKKCRNTHPRKICAELTGRCDASKDDMTAVVVKLV